MRRDIEFAADPEIGIGENLIHILRQIANPRVLKLGMSLIGEVVFNIRPKRPHLSRLHPSLSECQKRFAKLVQEHSHHFKKMIVKHRESLITRQVVQARIADSAIWLHAYACTLSKIDMQMKKGEHGVAYERDKSSAFHFFDLAEQEIRSRFDNLYHNADKTLAEAATKAMDYTNSLPNRDFYIHQKSPNAEGSGRKPIREYIKQFLGIKDNQTIRVQNRDNEGKESELPKHLQ
jgi:hypothetical protein